MPRRKEPEKFAVLGPKDSWHIYGLQSLTPRKFATVVGRILNGRYDLVKTRTQNRATI